MLLVEDSSVLLQVRCYCTSGVGWCVWKDVESAVYIESTWCMLLCMIRYSVRSCVLYI